MPINEVELKSINAIITIGGDGTILWANRYFKYEGIPPIISFAMGTINYMCSFSVSDYVSVLTKGLNLNRSNRLDSTYRLEVKSRLECTVTSFLMFSLQKIPMIQINLIQRRIC